MEFPLKHPKTQCKSIVRNQINQQRQQEWDTSINSRHLYLIQNKASAVRKGGARQKEQIEKYRLRIGLSGINSTQFIIGKRWTGLCHQCCKTETLKSFFHAGDITITDTLPLPTHHFLLSVEWKKQVVVTVE